MSLYSLSSAARSGFDTVMTTPQHSSQEVHFPGRQPRPLEIILDGSNGDRKSKLLLASLRLLTSSRCRSHSLSADRGTLNSPFPDITMATSTFPRYSRQYPRVRHAVCHFILLSLSHREREGGLVQELGGCLS